jgi:mannose-6-phosphate isomerase-like protein (cupin superfamily)
MSLTTTASTTVASPGPRSTDTSQERPWGSWEVLDVGLGYKVKRLSVRPHSRLSLQTHRYRSEHWLVVSGVATCVVGQTRLTAGPGGHVFVPRGAVHRIANEQKSPLLIVEVQLGSYLGEDDIVRLQDDHGRV